ncbi:hypothetical protein BC829DRAFT_405084 [Chytridium lagenaria]|nr:hypothetical protein BC829DRAFT_405084 [Chytridium lagenaria]
MNNNNQHHLTLQQQQHQQLQQQQHMHSIQHNITTRINTRTPMLNIVHGLSNAPQKKTWFNATNRTVQPRRNNPIASLEPVLALLDQLELAHQHPPSPTLPMNASSASLSSLNKRPESPSSSIASTLTNQSPAMASLGNEDMTFEIKGAYGSKTGLFGGWGGSSASASAA